MDHLWYYIRDGKSLGPVSAAELQQMLTRGELGANDLVWRDGMSDWSSAASMRIISPTATPPPVPPPPPTATLRAQPATRRRTGTRQRFDPRIFVWAIVGLVAILLCVSWAVRSRPPVAVTQDVANRRAAREPKQINSDKADVEAERSATALISDNVDLTATTRPPADPSPSAVTEVGSPPTEMPKPSVKPSVKPSTTANEPPEPNVQPAKPAPTIPTKQELYQVVDMRRSPTYSIHGLETKQSLHYRVLSKLEVERDIAAKTTRVVQVVNDTKLVAADDTSGASFAKALEGLKRQQYTYILNHHGEVTEFTGHKDSRSAVPLDLASGSGFQLTSVIDEDGWKELAELAFVVLPDGQQSGESWQRQMTHDWGALGSWSGVTTFISQPKTEGIADVRFSREMTYKGPDGSAGGLPFQIRKAEFEIQQAAGTVEFNIAENRVQTATENFDVRGTVSAEIAGVSVEIGLTEQQRIVITLSEQRLSLQ